MVLAAIARHIAGPMPRAARPINRHFVRHRVCCVTNRLSSFALRQARAHLAARPVLLTLVGVSLVLALSGPFRTLDLLGPGTRAVYWTAVVFGTYATGTMVMAVLGQWSRFSGWPRALRIAVGGVLVGLAVALILVLIDRLVLGRPPDSGPDVVQLTAIAILISLFVVAVGILQARLELRPALPRPVLILDRLPLAKRGALLCLSVEDHYVQVTTALGREMVLMRLGDAIREAGDMPGLQVHRSHWVALAAVRDVRRTGETAVLTLTNGVEVPVSRRYIRDLRQAGILPLRAADRAA